MAMATEMATHIIRHLLTEPVPSQLSLHRQLPPHLRVVPLLTHMLSMAATRTTSRCGTRPSLSNSRADPVPKDLQALSRSLVTVTDAHIAELRRLLRVCMNDACALA
jgi:hypothetical protein